MIAAFGALIYGLFGVRILSSSIVSLLIATRDYSSTGSGGIGAVSVGMDVILLPYVLLAMASICRSAASSGDCSS